MESNNPVISIIIPCYNQGKYIEETIQSVLNSSYTNFEIIVVNDGSSDSFTNKLLKSKSWSKTKIFQIPNQGVAGARNFGIKMSRGEFILPLDADDKIDKTYIEKSLKVFESNSNALIVYSKAMFFGAKNRKWNLPEFSIEMMLGQNVIFCSAIFKRSDFDKTIGYNMNMRHGFEDWDFWLSLLEIGNNREVLQIDEFLFYYRIKRRSRNRGISPVRLSELRRTIYENHKKLYSNIFLNPLYSFEYSNLQRTLEYRVGSILLWPLRQIKKML